MSKADIKTLWLYLGKRDKKGVRILCTVKARELMATRVNEVADLGLPRQWEVEIGQIVYDSRMNWELWAESADTFDDLCDSLKGRNYTLIPVSGQPEYRSSNVINTVTVNAHNLPQKKTMVRRRDD